MRFFTVLLLGVAAWVGPAGSAQAQEAGAREGFWWNFGLSYGWAHVSCDICASNRDGAVSATIGLGGTISRSFLLGGELNGWKQGGEAVDEYLGSVGAVAYWYPTGGAFYMKGGLAYMTYRIEDDENALTSSGFGPQLGVGYELWLGNRASVQPYLNAIVTLPTANLYINGDTQAEGVGLSLIQFGLGFTWH